ncbi:MAG: hypothetical protein IT551_05795 [Novosphingobium sp.]|nr:hypothetical protein [Novosphingobium sp.]
MHRLPSFLSLVAAFVPIIAGCSPAAPDGQVLAQLDGTEITRRDLAAEPQQAKISTQMLLERIIDRKLLVQAARDQGLDADPEYLAAFRRSREELLVAALRRKIIRTLRKPNDVELVQLVSNRPWAFDKRELIRLSPVAGQAAGLPDKTIDTAQLDAAFVDLVSRDNEPVIIDGATYRVIARNAAPLAASAQERLARAIWLEEQINAEMVRLLNEGRSGSAVKYSQGMGPGAE